MMRIFRSCHNDFRDRVSRLLQDLPALWNHPGVTAAQQRGLALEVFQEVRLRAGGLVAVRPRPEYVPLFAYALWRQHVAGGVRSSWPETCVRRSLDLWLDDWNVPEKGTRI